MSFGFPFDKKISRMIHDAFRLGDALLYAASVLHSLLLQRFLFSIFCFMTSRIWLRVSYFSILIFIQQFYCITHIMNVTMILVHHHSLQCILLDVYLYPAPLLERNKFKFHTKTMYKNRANAMVMTKFEHMPSN